jgi:hypothetical protein
MSLKSKQRLSQSFLAGICPPCSSDDYDRNLHGHVSLGRRLMYLQTNITAHYLGTEPQSIEELIELIWYCGGGCH